MKIKVIACILLAAFWAQSCSDDSFPVPPASTVPKFSYTVDNEGLAPATVTFKNESIVPERAGEVTYYWNFDDGSNSKEISPSHLFANPGVYNVNLVVVTSKSLEINEVTVPIVITDPNASGTPIFFIDGTNVYSALINTQAPIFVSLNVPGIMSSYGMTLDTVNSKIYITDFDAEKIYRTDYDGSNLVTFRSNIGRPDAAAIDYEDNLLYWDTDDGIRRADLAVSDESQFEDFVTGQANDPEGVSIDPVNRTIYWNTYDGGVWIKNLDGTGESEIIPGTGGGGAILVVGDRVYYDDYEGSGDIRLKYCNLDGSGITTVATDISRVVYGLAYDPKGEKIYWGDRTPGTIMRSNKDGSGAEPWSVKAGSSPRGIVLAKPL